MAQDWIVTGAEVVENDTITLDGNLIVKGGASLTMRNVVLKLNCQYDGQYKIEVEPEGSMFIHQNSIITATDLAYGYAFAVNGSAFEMKNSELHGAGWGPEQPLADHEAIMSGFRGLLIETDNTVIDANTLSNNHVGIILADSGATLTNNTIHSNKIHGILIYSGTYGNIADNSIQHDAVIHNSFRILNGENNRIVDNTIISDGGMFTMWSHGNVFENNSISGAGEGIALMFVSNNNEVRNNTISTDETGISIWGWNNTVEDNNISDTPTGIYMIYAYNTIVDDNVISHSKGKGIWVRHSSNNAIINNELSSLRRGTGLLLHNTSKRNVIHGNIFSNFSTGISLFYSSDQNLISGNEISSTKRRGVIVDDCLNNLIYRNNFVDLGLPAYDDGENRWDHEGQGNYWSDYTGFDTNGDGIGEAPYVIGPEGVDNLPLMTPITITSVQVPDLEPLDPPEFDDLYQRTITGEEVIENQTILLTAIDVASGGSLTLRNVNLITGGNKHTLSDLDVAPGGSLFIYDCKITHLEYGNGFSFGLPMGSTFVMKDSELHGCGFEWPYGGIQIYTNDAILENNEITDATVDFFNTSSGSLVGNTISKSHRAINLESSTNINIIDNTISESISSAISAWFSSDNVIIKDNILSDIWGMAISLWGSSGGLVDGNEIFDVKKRGQIIDLGENGRAISNTITNCYYGLSISSGQTAKGNELSNCDTGLIIGSNSNGVEGNTISNCVLGVDVTGSGNKVVNNTISNCGKGLIVGDEVNIIYSNNFVDNSTQAEDYGNTTWDQNGQGNFWSDYTGADNNGDGIGDTPYRIPPNGVDHYPLMSSVTAVVVEDQANVPRTFELGQNYPNPFNAETVIKYQLPKISQVAIRIYNLNGQAVNTLVDKKQPTGYYSINWDGKDENGKNVASGIYFYKLTTSDLVKVRKMLLVR